MSRELAEMSEQQWWEQFDHREVDKNGCYPGEPITHNYPLNRQTATILANESISEESPF